MHNLGKKDANPNSADQTHPVASLTTLSSTGLKNLLSLNKSLFNSFMVF